MPCNANAPLEEDLRVRLLLNEEMEVSSSSAERLRFEMAEIMEEGRTGVDGGIESSSLETGTGTSSTGGVGGPILPLVATTVLLLGAVNVEFAMAPRV